MGRARERGWEGRKEERESQIKKGRLKGSLVKFYGAVAIIPIGRITAWCPLFSYYFFSLSWETRYIKSSFSLFYLKKQKSHSTT
jgi:hypothetical protein